MRLAAALVVGTILSLGAMATVYGHAEPATALPGDGAVLNQPPAEVVLTMSQDMAIRDGANDIDVVDAAGTEVTAVAASVDRADRRKLSVPLPTSLAPGPYTVKWKTLSAEDGDNDQGELSFTFDPNGQPSPGTVELRPDLLNPGATAAPSDPGPDPRPSLGLGSDDSSGVTWTLVIAVAVGMFVLGAGGTFLLVQKKP